MIFWASHTAMQQFSELTSVTGPLRLWQPTVVLYPLRSALGHCLPGMPMVHPLSRG